MPKTASDNIDVPGDLPFQIERIGVVMEAAPGDPNEEWGVLNPACARAKNGDLILFPRVVAKGNYSRVGIAKVRFDAKGDPVGVERMGYALEPGPWYEHNALTSGCEDARITFIPKLDVYLMAYSAYGPHSSRLAFAISRDLFEWKRLGLGRLGRERGVDFDLYNNKDAYVFPEPINDPQGRPSIALIHRPDYKLWQGFKLPSYKAILPDGITETRPSMWISYAPLDRLSDSLDNLNTFSSHEFLAGSQHEWELLKIGGGAPPVMTKHGWLTLFHGVSGTIIENIDHQPDVHYRAGAMILDRNDPRKVLYRSPRAILEPALASEKGGIVDNVVFPTAVDPRENGRIDVYYGMADSRIGVGKLIVPAVLP